MTEPNNWLHPDNLDVVRGPEEVAIYDGRNDHLTTLPLRLWAALEREHDDPKEAVILAIRERLEQEQTTPDF